MGAQHTRLPGAPRGALLPAPLPPRGSHSCRTWAGRCPSIWSSRLHAWQALWKPGLNICFLLVGGRAPLLGTEEGYSQPLCGEASVPSVALPGMGPWPAAADRCPPLRAGAKADPPGPALTSIPRARAVGVLGEGLPPGLCREAPHTPVMAAGPSHHPSHQGYIRQEGGSALSETIPATFLQMHACPTRSMFFKICSFI